MERGAADRAGLLLVSLIQIAAGGADEVIVLGGAAPSAPDSGHQAQGLYIDVLAVVPMLASRSPPASREVAMAPFATAAERSDLSLSLQHPGDRDRHCRPDHTGPKHCLA